MIKFDKPKRSDYPQIVNLVNSTDQIYLNIYSPQEFKEFERASESVENLVEGEKNREYLCAFDENNSIIGYSSFRLKNNQTMWLSMIYIDSKYQKKGYGSIFLKKIEELAKIFKSMVLVLETDKKAIWAANFYKKIIIRFYLMKIYKNILLIKCLKRNKLKVDIFFERYYKLL